MGRPTDRSKINKKISESMREELKPTLSKLKEAASRGDRPVKQYQYAGISEATYYRWLNENPQLKEELTQLLLDYRKGKIKEAALIGAPEREQRYHANKMSELEYKEIMLDDPDFAEEVENARFSNLKLWARKNIAESIQTKQNIPDSWRFLEHMDDEMNKTKVEVSRSPDDKEDDELLDKYEEEMRKKIHKRVDKTYPEDDADKPDENSK